MKWIMIFFFNGYNATIVQEFDSQATCEAAKTYLQAIPYAGSSQRSSVCLKK